MKIYTHMITKHPGRHVKIRHEIFVFVYPFAEQIYTVGMAKIMYTGSMPSVWYSCVFKIPSEVTIYIYKWHCLPWSERSGRSRQGIGHWRTARS
jgi:hypothetical protein